MPFRLSFFSRPFFLLLISGFCVSMGSDGVAQTRLTPQYLSANDLSIATGQPSLVIMSNGSTHVPVWSCLLYTSPSPRD